MPRQVPGVKSSSLLRTDNRQFPCLSFPTVSAYSVVRQGVSPALFRLPTRLFCRSQSTFHSIGYTHFVRMKLPDYRTVRPEATWLVRCLHCSARPIGINYISGNVALPPSESSRRTAVGLRQIRKSQEKRE